MCCFASGVTAVFVCFLCALYIVMLLNLFFFLMILRPPRSTQSRSSAASDVYKRQDLQFEILGWTAISQSDGSDLSGERAKAVHDYLMEKGVDPRRMTYKGMGGAGCAGFKMLEKCRRVEIAITRNPYRKEGKP